MGSCDVGHVETGLEAPSGSCAVSRDHQVLLQRAVDLGEVVAVFEAVACRTSTLIGRVKDVGRDVVAYAAVVARCVAAFGLSKVSESVACNQGPCGAVGDGRIRHRGGLIPGAQYLQFSSRI